MKKYSRDNIIRMAFLTTTGNNTRSQQDRLDKIINWLQTPPHCDTAPGWSVGKECRDFFLHSELNIDAPSPENTYHGYSYNLLTAIVLALFLETYDDPFIQSLINNRYCNESDGENWVQRLETLIPVYEQLWQREGDGRDWDLVALRIVSQLYKLTLPEMNVEILGEFDKKVLHFSASFLALPEDKKVIAYPVIHRRLDRIAKDLEQIVKKLDPTERMLYDEEMNRNSR